MASSTETWKSREAFKKAKELDEARKAGNAPAELDEDGREINPHIPQYILKAPWYSDSTGPSLKHQRHQPVEGNKIGIWYNKGAKQGESANKYRKGACENCGAMTHQTKDCCERPRKVGAKYNGTNIKPDEVVETLNLSYDAKRDPYNGYDTDSYKEIMDLYEKAESERKKKKLQELMEQHQQKEVSGDGDTTATAIKPTTEELNKQLQEQEEQDTYTTENIAPIQKLDPKSRTTIRNLRIREDTAKYLYNLDVDSSYYEPKSRSMRENPLPSGSTEKDIGFIGDNFTRTTGDTQKFRDMQMFAWEAHDKGQDVDISSAPTQAALLHKEFQSKKEQLKNQSKKIILSKYGGEEHLLEQDKDSLKPSDVSISVPSSEVYTEYSASGKLIKGQELLIKSKYEEDIYINNHTSVFGSYWENGAWGYQCCKQLIKNTYCTGEHGRKLKEKQFNQQSNNNNNNNTIIENNTTTTTTSNNNNNVDNDKDKKSKKKSLKKAIKEQEELNKKDLKDLDERKLGYNSLHGDYNISKEDMEAYSLKRKRGDDPMANYNDNEDDS